MACKLDSGVQRIIIANVGKRLEKFVKDKSSDADGNLIPFNIEDFIKSFYVDMIRVNKGDVNQAVALTQMIPSAIDSSITLLKIDKKVALIKKLTNNGLNIGDINNLENEFEEISNVVNYLKEGDQSQIDAAQSNLITHPKKRGRPTLVRLANESLGNALIDLQRDFKAAPLNYNTTTGQETTEGVVNPVTGIKEYSNVASPYKLAMYATLKSIVSALKATKLENASELEHGGHKGFKLEASINDQGERILTLTDNEGNPIYFNKDGSINTENGGEIMFYSLREYNEKTESSFVNDVISRQTVNIIRRSISNNLSQEDTQKAIDEFDKSFREERKRQFEVTKAVIDTLEENPGAVVILDIVPETSSVGYVDSAKAMLGAAWNGLTEAEKKSIHTNIDDGKSWINIAGIQNEIELRPLPISNDARLVESIVNVLTKPVTLKGVPLTNQEKLNYVNQFIYTNEKFNLVISKGELVLSASGSIVDLKSSKAVGAILTENKDIKKVIYLQIKKSLLDARDYNIYRVGDDNVIDPNSVGNYANEVLVPNTEIFATPNAEGKILALNGYFGWAPPSGIVQGMESQSRENKATKKIINDAKDASDPTNPYGLQISKLIADLGTPSQRVAAMKWWKGHPLSNFIKVEVLTNIVNSDAWATWNIAGITLYSGADYTHVYHEAWHAFSQLYLTKEEKTKLYGEAAKQAGSFKIVVKRTDASGKEVGVTTDVKFSEATPRQLEEYIAEEFRSFAKKGGKMPITKSVRKSIFQKIWDFLKELFTGVKAVDVITQPDSVNILAEIFDNLYRGNITQYVPSVDNVMFDSANAGGIIPITKLDEELNYSQSKQISQSIDGLISKWIEGGGPHAATRAFKIKGNREKMFDSVKGAIDKRIRELTDIINSNTSLPEDASDKWDLQTSLLKREQVRILQYALDNWGDAFDMESELGTMGFYREHSDVYKDNMNEPIIKDDGSLNIDNTDNLDNTARAGFTQAGNTISAKDRASVTTLSLVKSLLEVNDKGEYVLNELGFPKPASFVRSWNTLVRVAGGETRMGVLYDNLIKQSKIHPIFTQLVNKLGNPNLSDPHPDVVDMWIKFLQDLSMPRIPLITFMLNKDTKGKLSYRVGRASAAHHKVKRKWESDFISNPALKNPFITKGKTSSDKGTNYLNLEAVVEKFILSKRNKRDNYFHYEIKPGTEFEFLKAVGVNMTDNESIRALISLDPDTIQFMVNHIAYANNVSDPDKKLKIINPIQFFAKEVNGEKININNSKDRQPKKLSTLSARIDELAEIEIENSDEFSSLSRLTASGDRQYEQSRNSSLTVTTEALNKVSKFQGLYSEYDWQHMTKFDFKNNPAARSSILLNSLFSLRESTTNSTWGDRRYHNGEPVTIQMLNLSGAVAINSDFSETGVSHAGMNSIDKFITDFHSMLGGYYGHAQTGSKNSYFSTKVSKIFTYATKKQSHLYIDTADFAINSQTRNMSVGMQEAFKIIKGYLQSEIEKIQMFKANPEYKKWKGFQNAGKFGLFDNNMLTEKMKAELTSSKFEAALKEAGISGITAVLARPEYQNLAKELETNFKNYFKTLTTDYTQNMLNQTKVFGEEVDDEGNLIEDSGEIYLYDAVQPQVYEDILRAQGYTEQQILDTLKRNPNGKYANEAKIDELKMMAMKSYTVNSWINKVEMITLYYGDITEYNHTKEEFNKRNSTFASTGDTFATDSVSTKLINGIKNPKGEMTFLRDYAATIDIDSIRPYDGTFNTAIIKDNVFKSLYFNQLRDLFKDHFISTGLKGNALSKALYGESKTGEIGSEKNVYGGVMKPYNEVNEGDGQGWITFDAYRILKKAEGKWTDSQEDAYQNIVNGKSLSIKELSDIFPVYKTQYAGSLKVSEDMGPMLPISSIHKFSLYPLIPSVIKNTPMDVLHKKMINQQIDYALFESGSKLSSITSNTDHIADDIYEGNDTAALKPDFEFTKNTIYLRYLKNQLDLNNSFKGSTNFSTQLRKLLTVGLTENELPLDFMKGKSYETRYIAWNKLSEAKKMESPFFKLSRTFEKRMSRIVKLSIEKLVEDVGWTWKDGKPIGEMAPMVNFIRKEMVKQGFTKHEVDFIDVNDEGELVRDVSTFFDGPKVERMLMAIVNNRIVKQNMTGEALVQLAVSFTQNPKFTKATETQNEEYGQSGLPFYKPTAKGSTKACKIKIALQGDFENLFKTAYFKKNEAGESIEDGIIEVYDDIVKLDRTTGKSYTTRVLNFDKSLVRLNEMITNDQWLDTDNNRKKITLTGVRIPVQGLNSMEFMEVYQFLSPEAGTIIILPSEIVAKSGGDFDVDKLTTYFPHITKEGTWVNDDTFDGDNWKEEIDKKLLAIDAKLKTAYSKELGIDATFDNIKAKLKDGKSRNSAIKVLKAQRDEAYIKREIFINDIKEGFKELEKKGDIPVDIKKLIKDNNTKGLLDRLAIFDKLNGLKNKGEGIYEAYKAIQNLKIDEIEKLNTLIDEQYAGKVIIDKIKQNPEFKALSKEYNNLKDQKKYFIKSVQNGLLNDIVNILSLNHNAVPLLTPNSVHLTKPLADRMESKVQPFNFKASRLAGESGVVKGISPSRVLEEDFNLKKHQDNVVGKSSLGIVAINNAYQSIFNAAGAYINPKFTVKDKFTIDPVTKREVPLELDVTVYLDHNTIPHIVNGKVIGKVISLSNLKDKHGVNSIAEIDSQLVNGMVDVEKDAWVAFIQGNQEVTPMLLFLNKIGVPFEDAVLFVSNPLVRRYVQEQKKRKGMSGDMIFSRGLSYEKESLKRKAKDAIWKYLNKGSYFPSTKVAYDTMKTLLNDGASFSKTKLEHIVNNKIDNSSFAVGAFLQYLHLEDVMQGFNDIKAATNVDTKKTGTLFDAQFRKSKVEDLYKSVNMPHKIIDYIENKSSISGFFVQQFATDLWGKMFKLRNNSVVNKFLLDILTDFGRKQTMVDITGFSPERLVGEFKDDFISYIVVNQLKSFEAGASKYYKGMYINDSPVSEIRKGKKVTYVEGINKAVFVKDVKGRPNIFINYKNITQEYANSSYSEDSVGEDSYSAQGLSPVETGTFNFNSTTGRKEYENFVVEREYLRHVLPISALTNNTAYLQEVDNLESKIIENEGESKEAYAKRINKMAYENFLRDKALDNTFNFFKMFKAGNQSYPKRMMKLIEDYPKLSETYSILKQFAVRGLKRGDKFDANHVNLILTDARDLDEDSVKQYYDDIKELSTKKNLILGGGIEIAEVNNFINDFFKRLSLFAFMQSGLKSGTETAFTRVVPYDEYSKIAAEAANKVEGTLKWKVLNEKEIPIYTNKKLSDRFITYSEGGVTYGANIEFLSEFYNKFLENNASRIRSERVAGKDYTRSETPLPLRGEIEEMEKLGREFIVPTARPGVFTLLKEITTADGRKEVLNNKEIIRLANYHKDTTYFVFNDSAIRNTLSSAEAKSYLEKYYQNRPMMFAHPDFGKGTGKGLTTFIGTKEGGETNITNINEVKALIDKDIRALEEAYEAGKRIVFLETGYAQDLIQESQINAPEVITTPTQVQSVEISSNAKGLAAALTNPTELAKSKGNLAQSYPVEFKGKTYKDAEAAYQALKSTATKDEPGTIKDKVSITTDQFKKNLDSLLEKGLKALKIANATGDNFVLAFHGGQKFEKPDKSKQYSGEFRNPDIKRIAESAGARYEGQMLFYTEEVDEYSYQQAIYGASRFAVNYGNDNPTVYAFLIPKNNADFTDRGIGEVGVTYEDIENNKIKEIGRTEFERKQEASYTTYNLMVDIIKAKLEQHPRLVSDITNQGGSAWILSSTHQPTKQNSVWETGGKNWFIKALNEAYTSLATPTQVQSTVETARTIYAKLGDKTQSKHVEIPGVGDLKDVKYDPKTFWSKVVPEAKGQFGDQIIIAYRGNRKNSFVKNYKESSVGVTIGNPFDWQNETGTRDEQGIKSTKKFIHWMITGDAMGNAEAAPEYRQAIINDIKSGKLKSRHIIYYQEKKYATHATALDYLINNYDWTTPTQTKSTDKFAKKNLFTVKPIQAVDKKAIVKASIATQYIGFGEGIAGSSTELYRQQAGKYANTGNYSTKDTIFVSIGGKRGTELQQKTQQDRTIKEALTAIEAGATLITDNKAYVESNSYNTGEKRLAKNLEAKGYNYIEVTIDGQVLGSWSKTITVPVVKTELNAAPKSEFFVYLSQQLSEKFGYVNPGSEREPSIMDILTRTQIISQADIDKRENEC